MNQPWEDQREDKYSANTIVELLSYPKPIQGNYLPFIGSSLQKNPREMYSF